MLLLQQKYFYKFKSTVLPKKEKANHHLSLWQVIIFCNSNIKDHWSQITITDYNSNKEVWTIAKIAKMWHRGTWWANAAGKMMPMDLLDRQSPHQTSMCEKHRICSCALSAPSGPRAAAPCMLPSHPRWPLRTSRCVFKVHLQPLVCVLPVVWVLFSEYAHRKGSCEQCSPSCDTETTDYSPYTWKSVLLDIKNKIPRNKCT